MRIHLATEGEEGVGTEQLNAAPQVSLRRPGHV